MARVVSISRICSKHLATKVSPFMANYRRELRMRADIRRKGKVEKVIEFVKRIKKIKKETGAV